MSTEPRENGDPIDDRRLRQRNIKLGLAVSGIAVAVMATALVRFVVYGLPKDREVYEQLEQQRSAESGAAADEERGYDRP